MNFFRRLFKKKPKIIDIEVGNLKMKFDANDERDPKPIKATVSFNVFGENKSLNYDFSKESQEDRNRQRQMEKRIAWTKESGERLNFIERELIGDLSAKKIYCDNGRYCVVFVREFVKNQSTGQGRIWLVDCYERIVLFSLDTNIIDSIFIINSGSIVFNQYKRDVKSDLLCGYDREGKQTLSVKKKVGIQLDEFSESGTVKGHFLDKKYSKFIFDV